MRQFIYSKTFFPLMLLLFAASIGDAQVAGGGDFTLESAVIASGGGTSADTTNNVFTIGGTAGQSAAGTNSSGGAFSVRGGFWALAPLAPTAADVNISGRVVAPDGITGIRNVTVSLMSGKQTAPRIARTNGLGYFKFDNVEVGQFYVVSVSHKNHVFTQNTLGFMVMEDLADVRFQADWTN